MVLFLEIVHQLITMMMKELHAIGNNLNQLARKAHQLNVIDVEQYDLQLKNLKML
ncbi:plasmid mobilization relaxosome protein MobC [Faecalibacillus intestinalis]|uniref:plasmid mobilization relaxosome protein MobC n=1 Tax=Faecalibacillus intestinalis TaxID=1982626 RepID=UPI0039966FAF